MTPDLAKSSSQQMLYAAGQYAAKSDVIALSELTGGSIPISTRGILAQGLKLIGKFNNLWSSVDSAVSSTNIINGEATNHINALRLQRSFVLEQAKSIFTETGELTQAAINSALRIIPGKALKNINLQQELLAQGGDLSQWGKYVTRTLTSSSGNFEVHFYRNSVTNKVYYDLDFKSVFQHQGGWDLEPQAKFDLILKGP